MSEKEIVSKTSLQEAATETRTNNEVAEVNKNKTDLVQSNAFTIVEKSKENAKEENSENVLAADKPLARLSQGSLINTEASSIKLPHRRTRSISNRERLQDGSSAEQYDFDHLSEMSEMLYDSEMEENDGKDYSTQRDTFSHSKVKDIVDHNDPNIVRLQTDNKTLQLTKLPVVPPVVPENSDRLFLDLDSISLDSIESDQSLSYQKPSTTSIKPDFFEKLGEVPNVDDIISADSDDKAEKKIKFLEPRGSGRFVDPLTGQQLPVEVDTEDEVLLDEVREPSVIMEEVEEEKEIEEFSFEDFDAIFYADQSQHAHTVQHEEEGEILDILISKNQTVGKTEFIPAPEVEPLSLLDILKAQVNKFLTDIIKQVVRLSERQECTLIFRRNLDKMKLFMKIDKTVRELIAEFPARAFLERKVTEYYRRRKTTRYLIPEKGDQLLQEFEKYKEANDRLDQSLGRENFMLKKTSLKIQDLLLETDEIAETEKNVILKFENSVRKTFKREEMPHLQEFVGKELHKIRELAKDISGARAKLIYQQNILGTLKAQIEDLQNIGNGLRVADYEEIQRQILAISKKIEDRSVDLFKLHDRYHNNLHIMGHSKLRSEMINRKLNLQLKTLRIFEHEQNLCRRSIFEIKKQRKGVKCEISDLSLQSGLVDKPTLLQDYDDTVEKIDKQQKVVDDLRHTYKKLEHKLKQLEDTCTNI